MTDFAVTAQLAAASTVTAAPKPMGTADVVTPFGPAGPPGPAGAGLSPFASPTATALGSAGAVYRSFPGAIPLSASSLSLNSGGHHIYAVPMVLPFDITVTGLAVYVASVSASTGHMRFGFVPAQETWVPATTGVVTAGSFTVPSTTAGWYALTGLSLDLTAGRWFRIFRFNDGGTITLTTRRIAAPEASEINYNLAYKPSGHLFYNLSSSGYSTGFADPIPVFATAYSVAAAIGNPNTLNQQIEDPMWVAYTS